MPETTDLTAFALDCSLRRPASDEPSSTDRMASDLLAAMKPHGIAGEVERVADYEVKPGVLPDMSEGDEWPKLREPVLAADIFILGTPIWLGQPSSIARRVLERMDAFHSKVDDRSRMPPAGKVALRWSATRTGRTPATGPAFRR